VTRVVDHGAIVAAYVGIGMAATIGISFLLVIPIEPIYWLLSIPAGLLIGYYANQRSDRRNGPWSRIIANGLFAAAATAVTLALLLLVVKALFFFADDGFRDSRQGGSLSCQTGADCVMKRYVDAGRGPELAAAGITDPATFTAFYWSQQFSTAGILFVLCLGSGFVGSVLYGVTRPSDAATAAGPDSSPSPAA
jgi:hypothetical protein